MQTVRFPGLPSTVNPSRGVQLTLTPSRDVGALMEKMAKCQGKHKKSTLRTDGRGYPAFKPGMSTARYVEMYATGNGWSGARAFFAPLNVEPCTLYSGEDLHEIIDDAEIAQDAPQAAQTCDDVPMAQPAPVAAPALDPVPVLVDPEPAAPVADPVPCDTTADRRREIMRAHGIAQEQIKAMQGYTTDPVKLARMLQGEADRYGAIDDARADWLRIYADVSDALANAAAFTRDSIKPADPSQPPSPVEKPRPPSAVEISSEPPSVRQRAKRRPAHYAIFNRHGAMVSWALGIRGRNHLTGRIDAWENHPDAPHSVRRALPDECAAFRKPTAPAPRPSVPIHAAHYRPAGPALRVAPIDPRLRIPGRFAPTYLLAA